MKPNLTCDSFINNLKTKSNKIFYYNRVTQNTLFFNFIYFTFLLLILLFLIYLYYDKKTRHKIKKKNIKNSKK